MRNINILMSSRAIVVVPDLTNKSEYINLFAVLKFFFSKNSATKDIILGIFLDRLLNVVKRKTKESFYGDFSEDRLFAIVEGQNREAYYSNSNTPERFIGVEIRYKDEIEQWFKKEWIFGELSSFINLERRRLLNE